MNHFEERLQATYPPYKDSLFTKIVVVMLGACSVKACRILFKHREDENAR